VKCVLRSQTGVRVSELVFASETQQNAFWGVWWHL
jgi:hypothetical protein